MANTAWCWKCGHIDEKHYPRTIDQGSWNLEQCDCGCVRDGK